VSARRVLRLTVGVFLIAAIGLYLSWFWSMAWAASCAWALRVLAGSR
jgi:hypothetical protein